MFKLNKNSFVVDLGAYQGEFSKYILETYNCRVDAYEPLDLFKMEHPKLRIINKAVWDGTPVKYQKDRGINNSIMKGVGEEIETVDIKIITNKLIDLLKMNIEGAEIEVLKRVNFNNIKQLLVEYHFFIGKEFKPPITKKLVNESVRMIVDKGFKKYKINNAPAYFFYI